MAAQSRLLSLQIVRALAAWTVVFHHYVQLFTDTDSVTGLAVLIWTHGDLGVDIFFVLSGFVMCVVVRNSNKGPTEFLIDRIFRIAPAYWFATALVVLCLLAFPKGFQGTSFTIMSLVKSLLFIPGYNPSGIGLYPLLTVGWTLIFEMFFYTALAGCMLLSRRWFLAIFVVGFALMPVLYPYSAPFSAIARDFRMYEFWAGVVLALGWTGSAGSWARSAPRVSLVAAVSLLALGIVLLTARNAPILFALAIVAVAILCEQFLRPESRIVRWLVHLGDISYSTYLMHMIVIGVALHCTGKYLSPALQFATLLATVIGTYGASRASYRWLENGRFVKASKKAVIGRIRRRSSSATSNVATDEPMTKVD